MAKDGVWDGLDKVRVGLGVVTAFMSDEYLEVLAEVNNAESPAEVLAAREKIKELMVLWREECPEYSFMVDCLFLFSERMLHSLAEQESCHCEACQGE